MVFNHIVEHYPPGTIYNLINSLANKYKNHKIFLTNSKDKIDEVKDMIYNNTNEIIVLHSTGRDLPIFSIIDKLITMKNVNKIFIFMHVSYNYLKYNKRFKAIDRIKKLSNIGVRFISPSSEVAKIYNNNNINCIAIKPGISLKYTVSKSNQLQKYYGKIITTCTGGSKIYQNIKGINKFLKIFDNSSFKDQALIVGNNFSINGISSLKLSHDEFLEVLSHSKAYIQLSKFECYNITAVEAKQLKIPIILSNVEGHIDSSGYGFLVKNVKEAKERLKEILNNEIDKSVIENNYINSLKTENVDSFYEGFLKLEEK